MNGAVAAPAIIARAAWGADESIRMNERQYAPIRKLIVHHTASANRPTSPAAVVRETYRYHVQGRGFSDVGYNFMIDHRGAIYEGRFARRYGADEPITGEDQNGWGVVGAHAITMNHGSCGVCLIGDFTLAAPTDAAIASLTTLLAWKAGRHRIDALEDDVYENLYKSFFRFKNISGHRDVGATLCPGGRLASRLPAVRQAVAARVGTSPAMVVNIPAVVRSERGAGQGPLDTSATTTTTIPPATGEGSATGTTLLGYRAITSGGALLGTKGVSGYGRPKAAVAAMASPGTGDGYAVVTTGGLVGGFGTVSVAGQTSGSATVVDIAVTGDGTRAWVLRADGSVAPVGGAKGFGTPQKTGVAGVAIECRVTGDGYWVLTADGRVRGYGAAKTLGGGERVRDARRPGHHRFGQRRAGPLRQRARRRPGQGHAWRRPVDAYGEVDQAGGGDHRRAVGWLRHQRPRRWTVRLRRRAVPRLVRRLRCHRRRPRGRVPLTD